MHKPVVTFRSARPADYLINVQQPEGLDSALEQALTQPADLMNRIQQYADDTHPYRDGLSSERTLDAIDALAEDGIKGLKRKPANLYRHRKMRKLLNYR